MNVERASVRCSGLLSLEALCHVLTIVERDTPSLSRLSGSFFKFFLIAVVILTIYSIFENENEQSTPFHGSFKFFLESCRSAPNRRSARPLRTTMFRPRFDFNFFSSTSSSRIIAGAATATGKQSIYFR